MSFRKVRSARAQLAPLLIALTLAGCASNAGLHTHAKLVDPGQLGTSESLSATPLSTAAWPKETWWTSFGDSQLDALMRSALNSQPRLGVAEARLRRAQALAAMAGARRYPQVDAGLKSTRQRFSEDGTVPPPIAGTWQNVNEMSLSLHYELDFWGKNRAAIDAALDRTHAAELSLEAARLMLTTSLAHAYLRLDLAYAQRDLAQDTLKQREHILLLTRKRVSAHIDSEIELTQAEAALPAMRERISTINESIALIGNQLAALQGKGPDAGVRIKRPELADVSPITLPTNLPAELIGRRPDVVAQRWLVEATTQDIKVAKTQFYPNINLSALVGLQSLGFDNFLNTGSRILGIGPAISLPIFDGGRLRGNLQLHQAAYDDAVENYNATVISALHDVVDQLVSLRWLKQQVHEQNQALELSQHAYDLARARYHNGLANYLQVLATEGQVLMQKQRLIQSKSLERELRLNLIRALGGGYQRPDEEDEASVPHTHRARSKS